MKDQIFVDELAVLVPCPVTYTYTCSYRIYERPSNNRIAQNPGYMIVAKNNHDGTYTHTLFKIKKVVRLTPVKGGDYANIKEFDPQESSRIEKYFNQHDDHWGVERDVYVLEPVEGAHQNIQLINRLPGNIRYYRWDSAKGMWVPK